MWKWIQRQSSPKIFYQTCSNLTPWFFWPFIGFLVIGLYWALIVSPADYQQGDGYRIIFIHVHMNKNNSVAISLLIIRRRNDKRPV